MLIYCEGNYVEKAQARVSVFNHGFLYGDGVFEGIRAYNGRVFRLKEHIDRLFESAKAIFLEIEVSPQEMIGIVLETLRRNKLRDAYVRLIVARGDGDLGLDPRKCPHSTIYCIADSITLYPDATYEIGLETITVSTRRTPPSSLNPRIKSLNYLNNILAKIEANQAGVLEAVMLSQDGYVCEGTGDNIFIIKNGVLITPPSYIGILRGVTRDAVLDVARDGGMEAREELFNLHDVYTADECFLTGTAAELIPVTMVDGRRIGQGKPGPIFKELLAKFRQLAAVDGELI